MKDMIVNVMKQQAEAVMDMPFEQGLTELKRTADGLAQQFRINNTEVWNIYLDHTGNKRDA